MTEIPDYRPLELMLDPKITKVEFDDFIGVWPNFMPKPLCDSIIDYSKKISDIGCTVNYENADYLSDGETVYKSEDFYNGALNRQDFSFLLNYSNRELVIQINQVLKSCANHYITQYQALKKQALTSVDIKVQRTPPGGGYHLWHHENADIAHSQRELVWMIYLNDMPDGEAETEFLYQRRRIKPTAGTVVVWPGGFTHTHKGNTVMTQDKYIVTGWYIKGK
jgi:hypothetical protein